MVKYEQLHQIWFKNKLNHFVWSFINELKKIQTQTHGPAWIFKLSLSNIGLLQIVIDQFDLFSRLSSRQWFYSLFQYFSTCWPIYIILLESSQTKTNELQAPLNAPFRKGKKTLQVTRNRNFWQTGNIIGANEIQMPVEQEKVRRKGLKKPSIDGAILRQGRLTVGTAYRKTWKFNAKNFIKS